MSGGLDASDWPPAPPTATTATTATQTQPPTAATHEFRLVGVRCPRCHLGGDIPDTIDRTICPRCETVFTVQTARAERPDGALSVTTITALPQRIPTYDDRRLGTDRRSTAERRHQSDRRVLPDRRDTPFASSGASLGSSPLAPSAEAAPTPGTAPARDTTPVGRPGEIPLTLPSPNPTGQWLKLIAAGIAILLLGIVIGWALTRDTAEGAVTGHPATDSPTGSAIGGPSAAAAVTPPRGAVGPGASADDPARTGTAARSGASVLDASRRALPSSTGSDAAAETATTAATLAPSVTSIDRAAPGSALPGRLPPSGSRPSEPVACDGLDCRMVSTSPIGRIPLPDDSVELVTPEGIYGWSTRVAGVEALTAWYLDFLQAHGWDLVPQYSVMDPTVDSPRDLGFATSAVYCRRDGTDAVAINIGRPNTGSDEAGVVMAIAKAPRPLACD